MRHLPPKTIQSTCKAWRRPVSSERRFAVDRCRGLPARPRSGASFGRRIEEAIVSHEVDDERLTEDVVDAGGYGLTVRAGQAA